MSYTVALYLSSCTHGQALDGQGAVDRTHVVRTVYATSAVATRMPRSNSRVLLVLERFRSIRGPSCDGIFKRACAHTATSHASEMAPGGHMALHGTGLIPGGLDPSAVDNT
jgi:hypothetical protein